MPRRTRILITRTHQQASVLAARLEALGAETVSIPTIELQPPSSYAALDAALAAAAQNSFDWLIFTSVNAVRAVSDRTVEKQMTLRPCRIAVIGPATASAVLEANLHYSGTLLVPCEYVAESLLQALLEESNGVPQRYLIVRAEDARDVIPDGLIRAGNHVTVAPAYSNVVPNGAVDALRRLFVSGEMRPDVVTFTSSSTVRNFFALMESADIELPSKLALASIGPITSQTLRELGHEPDVQAAEPTVESLVESIRAAYLYGADGRKTDSLRE